jgi:hypothetical protein
MSLDSSSSISQLFTEIGISSGELCFLSAGEHSTYQKSYLFTDKACLATDNSQAGSFFSQCAEKAGLDVVQYPFCSDLNLAEDVLHYVKKQLQKST